MNDGLPEGWAACTLGDVVRLQNGYAFPSKQFQTSGVAVIRQSNLAGDRVSLEKCVYLAPNWLEEKPDFILRKNDVLIGMSGSIGKLCIYDLDEPALQNQRTGRIVPRSTEFVDWRFVWEFLKTVERQLLEKGKGMGVLNVSAGDIESLPFNLAPLGEQRRIVAKLEKLLGKVDACQQRLAKITVLLKRFRQAVLAAACSGRLTADWRETDAQEGELPDGWLTKKLFDICRPKQWKTISTKELTPAGFPVYGANGQIGFYSEYNHEHPTILITCRGATCGRINISEPRSYVNGNAMALDDLDETVVMLKFVGWSLEARGLEDTITGSAQPQITRTSLEIVELPIPPLAEQQEIVRRVQALFALAGQLEGRYAKAKAHVEKLTQSILAKAFRGELVPQDPNDEPALVILERIRSQRPQDNQSNRKRKRARLTAVC